MSSADPLPVVVYSNPGCQPCRFTKKRFEDRGFDVRVVDVSEDTESYRKITEQWGYNQTPVVFIPFEYGEHGGLHWSGMRPDLIDQIVHPHHAAA